MREMLSFHKIENELIIQNLHYLFISHDHKANDANILIGQYLSDSLKINSLQVRHIFCEGSSKLFYNEIQNVVII